MRPVTSRRVPGRRGPLLLAAAAALLVTVGLTLILWPHTSTPTSTAGEPAKSSATAGNTSPALAQDAPSSTSEPIHTFASPPPTGSSSPSATSSEPADDDPGWQPAAPGSLPATTPAGADEIAAAAAAETFLRVFARPDDPHRWWERVHPLLTAQAADDYAGTDPARIPFTRVSGPGRIQPIADDHAHLLTVVRLPTDAGEYEVHLQHLDGAGWLVARLTPPEQGHL